MTLDVPPRKQLAADPAVESLHDLGVAVEELSWIQSREKTVDAVCEQACRLAKHEAEREKHVRVDGETISFSARKAALQAAIEIFCDEHRDVVLADSGKTRKLTHGSIGWKWSPIKIEFARGHDDESLLSRIDEAVHTKDATLLQYLVRLLKGIKVTATLTAHDLLDVAVKLSKRGLLERVKNESLADEDLAEVGLAAVQEEKLTLKISDYIVSSESGEPPQAA